VTSRLCDRARSEAASGIEALRVKFQISLNLLSPSNIVEMNTVARLYGERELQGEREKKGSELVATKSTMLVGDSICMSPE